MSSANLDNPAFQDDDLAREWFEARLWPNGAACPHCGATGEGGVTRLHGTGGAKGTKHRPGCFQCNACRADIASVYQLFEPAVRLPEARVAGGDV